MRALNLLTLLIQIYYGYVCQFPTCVISLASSSADSEHPSMRARTEATEIIPLDKEEVGCRSKSLKNDVEKSGPSPSRGLDLNVPQNVCHMPKKMGCLYISPVCNMGNALVLC
jgi:hypothetical protein